MTENKINKNSIGLGLRVPHYKDLFKNKPNIDFFEIISENFMATKGLPMENLLRVLENYPVVLHGTSMGLGNNTDLNPDYLRDLKELCRITHTPYFTDHLCWTGFNNYYLHDLLPLPYTEKVAAYIAQRIKFVQDYMGIPFGLENLSSYVEFSQSEMTEWEFYNKVVELSGCYYMLDINNIFVSSANHGFNPLDYLNSIKWEKVLQCHIAGHSENSSGIIVDTHDNYVRQEVWDLYKYAWNLSGGFPTLLEWDGNFISLEETHKEALKAKSLREKKEAHVH